MSTDMQLRERTREQRFRVMGSRAHVALVGGSEQLVDRAQERLDELEARWSRFRPDSEISRLNAAQGRPVVVSALTFDLVERAVSESVATEGLFDPTILSALVAAGYDRDFSTLQAAPSDPASPVAAPGVEAVALDPIVRAVRLRPGTGIDVGGIAKGFAADVVSSELLDDGAAGACVNVGGDVRVSGVPPDEVAWSIEIEPEPGVADSRQARPTLSMTEGGIATTSTCRRVWRRGDAVRHHVIDPRTGTSATGVWRSVTVVAGDATAAEVGAKAALLTHDAATATRLLTQRSSVGLAFDDVAALHALGDVEPFVTC